MNTEQQTLDEITASIISGGEDQVPSGGDEASQEELEETQLAMDDAAELVPSDEIEEVEEDDIDLSEEEEEADTPEDDLFDEEDNAQHDEDGPQYLTDEDDELLIEVKVDGELVYKTVKDAKAALSGEGAISKRLKEAGKLRQSAQAEFQKASTEIEDRRSLLAATVGEFSKVMFQPLVAAPDEALRGKNPSEYLVQEGMYNQDQRRIAGLQQAVGTYMTEQQEQRQKAEQAYKIEQNSLLNKHMPDMADPVKGKVIAERIFSAASHYGFTQEEIGATFDHRIYLMADDAARYRALQSRGKQKPTVITPDKEDSKVPRRLRSGVTRRNAVAKQAKSKQERKTERARRTGKVGDIAAMIVS